MALSCSSILGAYPNLMMERDERRDGTPLKHLSYPHTEAEDAHTQGRTSVSAPGAAAASESTLAGEEAHYGRIYGSAVAPTMDTDHKRGHETRTYVMLAVVVLLLSALTEAARLFLPWPGITATHSRVTSALLIMLWGGTATALLLRRKSSALASCAWIGGMMSVLTLVVHALMIRTMGTSILGLLYIPDALVLGFALKRVFDGGELRRLQRDGENGSPGLSHADARR